MKYISSEKIWFEPTPAILALDGRELYLRYPGGEESVPIVNIDNARQEGEDAGKCCVALAFHAPPPLPIQENEPTIASDPYIEFLTQDGLEIILSFVQTHSEDSVLVLPPDWEFSDR